MPRPKKYDQVAEQLLARIEAGDYAAGEPLPSEGTLADEYGVHRLTLRKALDVLCREGVVARRHGWGAYPTSAASSPSAAVLYVGGTQGHFDHSFYTALCAEAQERRRAVASFMPNDEPGTMAQFRRLAENHRRLVCAEAAWQGIRDAVPADVHVTRVSGFGSLGAAVTGERRGYQISTDTYRAVKLAAEHLIESGHRRIGYVDVGQRVDGEPLPATVDPHREPCLGYRAALQAASLTDEFLMGIPDAPEGKEFQGTHYESMAHQLSQMSSPPTAFVCIGDFRAGPLLRALRARKQRVPEDASVVGIGNTPWTQWLDPPLTSVCLGEREMARLALALSEEPDRGSARIIRVAPVLVLRGSTGAAR